MAFKTIKRPKIKFEDRFYLKALFGGLIITFQHIYRSLRGTTRGKEMLGGSGTGITMQYPEHRWDKHLPSYYRGIPSLVRGEDGRERCVSCQMCEFICPARAITIVPGEIDPDSPCQKQEKAPKKFEIDMLRCIYCGMCEEACPEQAIFLSQDYLITTSDKKSTIYDKEKLYALGGTKKGLINKWNQYK
ncbi:MAG: NADH-quinone oxidoreductase subunit I [Akkermansia sp.]